MSPILLRRENKTSVSIPSDVLTRTIAADPTSVQRVPTPAPTIGPSNDSQLNQSFTTFRTITTAPQTTLSSSVEAYPEKDIQDGIDSYVTLTISQGTGVYTTAVQLGNSFPTSLTSQTTTSVTHKPSSQTGTIIGIVIGVVASLALLAGVAYVYFLRLKQWQRIKEKGKKKRRRRRKGKEGDGAAHTPPPAGDAAPPPDAAPDAAAA